MIPIALAPGAAVAAALLAVVEANPGPPPAMQHAGDALRPKPEAGRASAKHPPGVPARRGPCGMPPTGPKVALAQAPRSDKDG